MLWWTKKKAHYEPGTGDEATPDTQGPEPIRNESSGGPCSGDDKIGEQAS